MIKCSIWIWQYNPTPLCNTKVKLRIQKYHKNITFVTWLPRPLFTRLNTIVHVAGKCFAKITLFGILEKISKFSKDLGLWVKSVISLNIQQPIVWIYESSTPNVIRCKNTNAKSEYIAICESFQYENRKTLPIQNILSWSKLCFHDQPLSMESQFKFQTFELSLSQKFRHQQSTLSYHSHKPSHMQSQNQFVI